MKNYTLKICHKCQWKAPNWYSAWPQDIFCGEFRRSLEAEVERRNRDLSLLSQSLGQMLETQLKVNIYRGPYPIPNNDCTLWISPEEPELFSSTLADQGSYSSQPREKWLN